MTPSRRQFRSIRARIAAILILLGSGLSSATASTEANPGLSVSRDHHLYRTISALDQRFSDAYNQCATARLRSLFASGAEFYFADHGRASRADVLDGIRSRGCGHFTREVDPASVEVFDLPGYGAVQVGRQQFCAARNLGCAGTASNFLAIWRQLDGNWKIVRLIRYGYHNTK